MPFLTTLTAAYLAAPTATQDSLLQYGAIGAIALLAIAAVGKLFARQVQAHERDIARADKAEAQLLELNALIRDRLVEQLTRATEVTARAAQGPTSRDLLEQQLAAATELTRQLADMTDRRRGGTDGQDRHRGNSRGVT